MKRIFLFTIFLLSCAVTSAGDVTLEQAQLTARRFVSKQFSTPFIVLNPADQPVLKRRSARGQLPFYAFNIGRNDGFVIVSGDDRTPQILGYAKGGQYDEAALPEHMRAWLQGYADQIEYLRQTGAKYEAPRLLSQRAALTPLLKSTWDQGAPYNNKCPLKPSSSERTVTGCVATALAQVINYYRYPSQTLAPIPAYTTSTLKINMPEIPQTTIDWTNMRNSYAGSSTTAQKNAVATLMLLCGQAVMMDYDVSSAGGSGTALAYDVKALQKYFGYDKTVRALSRNAFSTADWESMIYDELAAGRPVLYSGASTGGGHAFVVDGYDGNGLFHINWGWGGYDDSFFLLSVLNPYNNESIGSSSSGDGFSFGQEAIVGIQYGTTDVFPELLTVYGIENKGKTQYTRSGSSANFTGVKIKTTAYNMSGDTHQMLLNLALYDANNEFIGNLSEGVSFGDLDFLYGGAYTFSDISFGANLADGDYYIVPVGASESSEYWEPCWRSNVYSIKATISGNTLTLTEPTIQLSATIAATGSTKPNTTVPLLANVTNNGGYFNDYVYLLVDNSVVGGRMLEVEEGGTAAFNIDFMPTTTGTKKIVLAYKTDGNDYVPFATGSVTISYSDVTYAPKLDGTLSLTNANSDGNLEELKSAITANVSNIGNADLEHAPVVVDLYKYNATESKWSYVTYKGYYMDIAVASTGSFSVEFTDLEAGANYLAQLSYQLDSEWYDISESRIQFKVLETAVDKDVKLAFTCNFLNMKDEILSENSLKLNATFTNTGVNDYYGQAEMVIYPVDSDGNIGSSDNFTDVNLSLPVGQQQTVYFESNPLRDGQRYVMAIFYEQNPDNWVYNNQLYYFTVDLTATGIHAVSNGSLESRSSSTKGKPGCVDLQGRPVAHPTKGIYFVEGKKIVVR